MPRKYTQEEAEAIMRAAGFEPEGEYVNRHAAWPGVCALGHRSAPRLGGIIAGQGPCKSCAATTSNHKTGEAAREAVVKMMVSRGFQFVRVDMVQVHEARSKSKAYLVFWCSPCSHEFRYKVHDLRRFPNLGCPRCSVHGYQLSRPGTLYLLARVKDGVEERQYGISNDLKRRMSEHKRHNWTLIDKQSHKDGGVIQRREARIKRAMKLAGVYPFQYSGEKFTGFTEAWTERMLEPFDSLPELNAWAIATIASHKETDGERK